jgi:delta 1-pyrroline-5-carboxylate dehydrogenase
MVHQATRYSEVYAAWERWMLTEFDYRSKCLLSIKDKLNKDKSNIANVIGYHLTAAKEAIGAIDELVGPTGETNELYTAGRGVALLIQDEECEAARLAIMAQLTAAVVAGNSVILCSDDAQLVSLIKEYFNAASLPSGLIQLSARDSYHAYLMDDVRSVGYVGDLDRVMRLNRELAKREGVIVSLVSETDLSLLPIAQDPKLSFRFVTERTRTINITAIGGNASLLELGSGEH